MFHQADSSEVLTDNLKPVWTVSQVGLIGMAWSGVGQLDSTLTPEQQANSYFVSHEDGFRFIARLLMCCAVVLCVSRVLVFYPRYLEMVYWFHSSPYRERAALGSNCHLHVFSTCYSLYWWHWDVSFLPV